MFAKNLEAVLFDLLKEADTTYPLRDEIARRFDALRGSRLLLSGRQHRAARLGKREISSAILGLVPVAPGWAGHAATLLSKLRPVGGRGASYAEAPNLAGAVQSLIENWPGRRGFIGLEISLAEVGINARGHATIVFEREKQIVEAHYVPVSAASLLVPGAEHSYSPWSSGTPTARSVRFTPRFFDLLTREIANSLRWDAPAGDGSEYDADDAQKERFRALKVQPGSTFLQIGVDTQVDWPKEEILAEFDKFHIVMMPRTNDTTQSIHIDMAGNSLDAAEAVTLANRFLSMLSWCSDSHAVIQNMWSGNPVPVPVSKENLAVSGVNYWLHRRSIPKTEDGQKALSLYREGCNAHRAGLVSFEVLSFFKIIEIRYEESKKSKRWIRENLPHIRTDFGHLEYFKHFDKERGEKSEEDYIWSACRIAVAHASNQHRSDSDLSEETQRLSSAASILRDLARRFIVQELHISDSPFRDDFTPHTQTSV